MLSQQAKWNLRSFLYQLFLPTALFYCWSSYDPFISPCHHTFCQKPEELLFKVAFFFFFILVLFIAIITSVIAWIPRWCTCTCLHVIIHNIFKILQINGYYLLYYWTINLLLQNITCNASCCNKFSVLNNNCVFVEHYRYMEDKWSKFRQH